MPKSTIAGYWRQYGSTSAATAAVFAAAIKIAFDPTQAAAASGATLPKGAIPIGVQSFGGATGGTNPTVDVGTSGDTDGFANELDADGVTAITATGALLGIELTADTAIHVGVGASAATGGTTTILVFYVMADSGT